MSNEERKDRALKALIDYCEGEQDFLEANQQDTLSDLLTDLRHWADAEGLDFQKSIRVSLNHFNEEI